MASLLTEYQISIYKNSVVLQMSWQPLAPAVLIESDNILEALGNKKLLIYYLNEFSSLSVMVPTIVFVRGIYVPSVIQ